MGWKFLWAILFVVTIIPTLTFGHGSESAEACEERSSRSSVLQFRMSESISLTMSKFFVDIEAVQELLPRGMELTPKADWPAGKYVISMYVAEIKTESLECNKVQVALEADYSYHRLQVAFQARPIGSKMEDAIYQTHVLLDSKLAIEISKAYGIETDRSSFDSVNGTIKSKNGKALVKVQTAPVVDYDPAAFKANLAAVQKNLGGTSVNKERGKFVCSRIEYDLTQSKAEPVAASWKIYERLEDEIASEYIAPGLDKSKFGGVHLQAKRLKYGPVPCE